MARQRVRQTAPEPPNGFVASAALLPTASRSEAGKPQGWQSEAWKLFDQVGELRYISTWIGNMLSRAELHAAKREGNSLVPVTEGPAREAMDALYGGIQGQAQMLQLLGVDLTVGGEGYVVALTEKNMDQWHVLATGKVVQDASGKLFADLGDEKKRRELSKSDLVMRVWTPHPREPMIADAPTRSNLKTLHQIVGYDDHISAQLTSRLAGAGLLLLPSEIQFAIPEGADPQASQAQMFMQVLSEAMVAAKEGGGGPESFVPIVTMAPGEWIGAAEHMKFWSDLDAEVINMRTAAIMRFAIGMDVPPEALLGNGDSNHWNAFLSEEGGIKAHLEPRLGVVAAACTVGYLRPALKGVVPDDELNDWYVVADTSQIRVRPERSDRALELNDRGILGVAATLREVGFRPEDKMDEAEYVRWLLQRVSVGAVSPELSAQALALLGAPINPATLVAPNADGGGLPDHTRTDTEVAPNDRTAPERPEDLPLVAACEVMVFRALERAGNRLRNKPGCLIADGCPSHQAYLHVQGDPAELLIGSWEVASELLDFYDVDPTSVVAALQFYTGGLITSQQRHNRTALAMSLRAWSDVKQKPLAISEG